MALALCQSFLAALLLLGSSELPGKFRSAKRGYNRSHIGRKLVHDWVSFIFPMRVFIMSEVQRLRMTAYGLYQDSDEESDAFRAFVMSRLAIDVCRPSIC